MLRYTLGYSGIKPAVLVILGVDTRIPKIPGYPKMYSGIPRYSNLIVSVILGVDTGVSKIPGYPTIYSGIPGYQTWLFWSYSGRYPGIHRVHTLQSTPSEGFWFP